MADPVFGKFYADHMAVADYTEGLGWRDARIIPTGQWQLHQGLPPRRLLGVAVPSREERAAFHLLR